MLQDLEAGKPLEHEALNGIVVKVLQQAGRGRRSTRFCTQRSPVWIRTCGPSAYDGAGFGAGRTNWKVSPGPSLTVTQSRPPCASMIDRLMERPMPNPFAFVV